MKTQTEFNGIELKTALAKVEELSKAGKNPDEISQALGEQFKREGDKLKLFKNAVEVIRNRAQGLKRVVVISAAEGDKIPSHAEKCEDLVYLPEYYPALPGEEKGRRRGHGGRGGGRRDGRGGRDGSRRDGRGDARVPGGGGGRAGGRPPWRAQKPLPPGVTYVQGIKVEVVSGPPLAGAGAGAGAALPGQKSGDQAPGDGQTPRWRKRFRRFRSGDRRPPAADGAENKNSPPQSLSSQGASKVEGAPAVAIQNSGVSVSPKVAPASPSVGSDAGPTPSPKSELQEIRLRAAQSATQDRK